MPKRIPFYESETTQFLKQYKKDHPGTHERQVKGFNRLWNVYLDSEKLDQFKESRVAQRPYVYLNYENEHKS
ncbi:DUF3460 family protein [Brackiella oedipodis]|uniref:DUF3460 family protein n=1 Tax=Brackiella oedipodis TaxID=124225 RepID=UPI00048CA83A|nr:DUF3460 family protein [Brackiella oedipodis]